MPISVMSFAISFVLTAAFYGAGPLLLRLRKKPIPPKPLKWLHIGYTVVLALIFAFYNSINGYKISFFPALLWGSIFYWWNCSYFDKKRRPSVPLPDPKREEAASTAPAQPDPAPVLQEAPPEPAVELPPAVQESSPADLAEVKKPKRKPNVLIIVLAAALVISLAGNIWQAAEWSSEKKAMASEIKGKEQSIANLKSANSSVKSELSDLRSYHFNTYYSTGYIVNGSTYFHRYDCPVVEAADTYQSHNTEFCKWLGYSGCPVCHSGISISKIGETPKQSAP